MASAVEIRSVVCRDRILEYTLTRKKVKNINLRVKPDGSIAVSASNKVSVKFIDNLVKEKQDFIIRALERYEKNRENTLDLPKECISREELEQICHEVYQRFQEYGIPYPQIKMRTMTSRWGSCRPMKASITLNTKLLEKPRKCVEYVVMHEFAHFIHPNHSKDFHDFMTMMMPDWKERKRILNA